MNTSKKQPLLLFFNSGGQNDSRITVGIPTGILLPKSSQLIMSPSPKVLETSHNLTGTRVKGPELHGLKLHGP